MEFLLSPQREMDNIISHVTICYKLSFHFSDKNESVPLSVHITIYSVPQQECLKNIHFLRSIPFTTHGCCFTRYVMYIWLWYAIMYQD